MKLTILALLTLVSTQIMADDHHDKRGRKACAVVFQGEDFTGERMLVRKNARISDLSDRHFKRSRGNWDNRISSAKVMPGCTLTAYRFQNFGIDWNDGSKIGWEKTFDNSTYATSYHVSSLSDLGVDNEASSLECSCTNNDDHL